jgi:purine-cytosine permease-like protein
MAKTAEEMDQQIAEMDDEQIPVGDHELHGPGHFAGLYAAEHVAATEFIFGATFVILGAGIWDILIGLLIGNILAVLSFRLITAPIATQTRLSLYAYLQKMGGAALSRLYNAANVILFLVISAAMITVSATAVRRIVGFPAQTEAYPTHWGFVVIAVLFALVAVLVAAFGFNALAEFATICGPWLMVMFTTGGLVLIPAVAETVTGFTTISSFNEFIQISGATIFTGQTPSGEPGISLWEVAGFAWAANTLIHFGLIDMAILRYAKKNWYGLMSSTGMLFGHYVAWISAGFMGAATAAITLKSITVLDPGDVAWYALGLAGYATVIVSGWTTANPNLYRAGLAAQAVFPSVSRVRVTLMVGVFVIIAACFPFVYRNFLPLITYAGVALVPIGGIVFAEHFLFPRLGLTKFWAKYKGVQNIPAILTWGISLLFAVGLSVLNIIPYAFLFIPTWAVSIGVYILLAKRAGADQDYPEEEANEELFQERVKVYREQQAKDAPAHTKDTRVLTRVLRAVWIVTCLVILVYAFIVLFWSPDVYTYLRQRETFYTIAISGTVIYFVAAYWELRRNKAFANQASSESAAERPRAYQADPAQR